MPYARTDPRAQLPADLAAIGEAAAQVPRRTLSAPAPGTPASDEKPSPTLPALGEVVALSQHPRDGKYEVFATEAGIADGARRRMDGSAVPGFLDGVLPPDDGGSATERSSPIIFNSDDRGRVPPFSPGWGTTVKIFGQWSQWGKSKTCTGTIIRDGYVLTAAHCVYDKANGWGWNTRIVVVPALDGSYMPYGAYEARNTHAPVLWINSYDEAQDWALIEVGVDFDSGLGSAAVVAATDSELDGLDYRTHGYPGELGPSTSSIYAEGRRGNFLYYSVGPLVHPWASYSCSDAAGGWDGEFVCTTADTSPGMSGAGIWKANVPHQRTVFAVDSRAQEWPTYENISVRLRQSQITAMASIIGPNPNPASYLPPAMTWSFPEETSTEPQLVSDGYDSMSAFVQDRNGEVLAQHRGASGWSPSYELLGGSLSRPISVVSEATGRIHLYGVASFDGNIWGRVRTNGVWSGWASYGRPGVDPVVEKPALTPTPGLTGHSQAVTDSAGVVWIRQSVTWGSSQLFSPWRRVTPAGESQAIGPPAIHARSSTEVDVVYWTQNVAPGQRRLHHRVVSTVAVAGCSTPPCVSAANDLGGAQDGDAPSLLTLVSGGLGRTELLFATSSGPGVGLQGRSYSGGTWGSWNSVDGGESLHSPAAAHNPLTNRFFIVATGTDGRLYTKSRVGGGPFTPWYFAFPEPQPVGNFTNHYVGAPAVAVQRGGATMTIAGRWISAKSPVLSLATQDSGGTWLPY